MRLLATAMIATVAFAGCVDSDGRSPLDSDVQWYRVEYDGSNEFTTQASHGWLSVVHNRGYEDRYVSMSPVLGRDESLDDFILVGSTMRYTQDGSGAVAVKEDLGIAASEYGEWETEFLLPAGESTLLGSTWLNSGQGYPSMTELKMEMQLFNIDREQVDTQTKQWSIKRVDGEAVTPGDHVQTITVGMWLNGTSFYTNAAAAIQDPDFPAAPGWVRPDDSTDPLPIYVYDQEQSEQPIGSKDTCHFTTISGYNTLLKSQVVGATSIRLLQPEEAYTNERALERGHPLYGEALVFMNTVVAHGGATGTADEMPNPEGECYQRERACAETAADLPNGIPDEIRAPLVEQCEDALQEDD